MARGTVRSRDFRSLKAELLKENALFVDPEFPPDPSSLTFSRRPTRGFDRVIWKRPMQIASNPRFIVKGASRFDLDQGALGNCWFIAGAAVVATYPKLLSRVVPPDQEFDDQYAGIFHFNFWWYGTWTEVIIDDYLPTDGQGLIYGRNREQPNEFWPALLEKAYAKLRGCYEALDGGKFNDSIVDMTGSISERIDLRTKSNIPPNLYDTLLKSYKMNSMLGASINLPENHSGPLTRREVGRENGLYMGHAYSITGFAVVPYQGSNVQLLRIRNPWGRHEWNKDWSDRSIQMQSMSPEVKQQMGIVIRNDGEFWISYKDFLDNFDEISLSHLQPDGLTSEIANDERKQNWQVVVYHDGWIKGVTAGGCGNPPYKDLYWKNPQFFVTLKDPDATDNRNMCTLIISLIEKEKDRNTQIAMSFEIYQLKNPQLRPLDGETVSRNAVVIAKRAGVYEYNREKTKRFELSPGTYLVIPSTFNPNEEAEFMLRLITEKPFESGVMDEESGPTATVTPAVEDPFKSTFKKYAEEDGKLYARELKHFLITIASIELKERLKFSTESCRSLVTMLDKNKSGALDFEETEKGWKEIKAYMMVFKKFDKDGSGHIDTYELGNMLANLGFPISRMVQTAIVRRYGGKNRKLPLADFIIVVCKLTLMFTVFKEKQLQSGGGKTAEFTMNEFLYYSMFC